MKHCELQHHRRAHLPTLMKIRPTTEIMHAPTKFLLAIGLEVGARGKPARQDLCLFEEETSVREKSLSRLEQSRFA